MCLHRLAGALIHRAQHNTNSVFATRNTVKLNETSRNKFQWSKVPCICYGLQASRTGIRVNCRKFTLQRFKHSPADQIPPSIIACCDSAAPIRSSGMLDEKPSTNSRELKSKPIYLHRPFCLFSSGGWKEDWKVSHGFASILFACAIYVFDWFNGQTST